jgi:hypothetical protein
LKQLQGIPNPDPRTISEAIYSLVIKIEEFKNSDEILSEQMSNHEIMNLRNKHALIQTKLSSISANIGNSAEPRLANPIVGSYRILCWILSESDDPTESYRIPGDGITSDSVVYGSHRIQHRIL